MGWPAEHHVGVGQLVIAWTFSQPGITCVLCGARDVAQATKNAAAVPAHPDAGGVERHPRGGPRLKPVVPSPSGRGQGEGLECRLPRQRLNHRSIWCGNPRNFAIW